MSLNKAPLKFVLNSIYSFLCFFLQSTGVSILYRYISEFLRYVWLGFKIPGIDMVFVVKNFHLLLKNTKNSEETLRLLLEVTSNRGKIVRIWFGTKLMVALFDPRDVEIILASKVHLEKSTEYKFFQPWLGDGLLISNGDKWKTHRKLIAPTFHQSILKTFVPVFNKNAQELVAQLRKETLGKICDIHEYFSSETVDVLLETVMGAKKTKEAASSFNYVKAVIEMCGILHFRQCRLWMYSDFIFSFTKLFKQQLEHLKIIHSLTDKVIQKRKKQYADRAQNGELSLYSRAVKEMENENYNNRSHNFGNTLKDDLDEDDENVGEKRRLAFLDFMVEASQTEGNKISDEDIREEVNTIMFEGHDTIAAASSFFICVLGVYQDIQDRVYQEIKEILQDSNRPITFNDTLEMKYTERVLLEALRLFPPVPIIGRTINEEIKLASASYTLPKGTTIGIAPFKIHRDPEYYPNPEKFDPDRFLPEQCQRRHHYAFIPFSAGPRSCVGRKYAMLKLKIMLATVVRNFKVKSLVSDKSFKLQADIILKRTDGFKVILEDRNCT